MEACEVHLDLGIRGRLEHPMLGIRWQTRQAKSLTTTDGQQPGIIASTAVKIGEYLIKSLAGSTRPFFRWNSTIEPAPTASGVMVTRRHRATRKM